MNTLVSAPFASRVARGHPGALASLALFGVLLISGPANGAVAPSLGTAESYAVLGATPNVNNTGPTVVTGDLGVYPAAAVVGFPPGTVIGSIHAADANAQSAQSANTAAYGALAGQACNTTFGVPTDLATMTLVPGVYCFASSASNTGLLQLDAQGDPNAVWVFQIASTLITGSGSTVTVINGGQDCNVFWQVGSSAILGTTTTFVGNILALTDITLQTSANLSGRALAQTGTVTLASNTVSVCSLAGALAATTVV
ncbi:MAG: ice-binding family protein, partial [Rudaea sp.]